MAQYAEIIADVIEERYGRGWYCLGKSEEYADKPVQLNYFGKKLVAYRGEQGQFIVLDAYCPHMGADLSLGYIEGNSLRCPFHAWRWDEEGVCDDIPYAKNIPEKARIKRWPTLERNGLVFVYQDPENNPPVEDEMPPVIAECSDNGWSDWTVKLMKIETNCRELVDNMSDKAHFGPIHGSMALKFENTFHKHIAVQRMEGESPRLSEGDVLTTTATYYGPAYMITVMTGKMQGFPVESQLLVSHIPTSTESFDLRFGVMVKKFPGVSEEESNAMVAQYVEQTQVAFGEDVAIWHTKTRVDNPLLCDGDGPINRLRQWYNQFFVDRTDVPHTWDEPKEYTVNAVNPIPTQKLALDAAADEVRKAEAAIAEAKAKQVKATAKAITGV